MNDQNRNKPEYYLFLLTKTLKGNLRPSKVTSAVMINFSPNYFLAQAKFFNNLIKLF